MVPEDLPEGAASSALEPTADGNPEAEAEVAESTEVAVGGSTGFSWADASEDAPEPSAVSEWEGLRLAPQWKTPTRTLTS